ncbi:MAG: putative toxin-antitoxin system toxin component, PIN family [Fluviibacter sp.]
MTASATTPPPRIVLDTNVVMDLFHFQAPALMPLADAIARDQVVCLANQKTLNELERVTGYPQFRLDDAGRACLIRDYSAHLAIVPLPTTTGPALPPLPKCRDPDDQMFLELAQQAAADLLISRDNLVLKLARARQRPCPFAILSPDAALIWLFGR